MSYARPALISMQVQPGLANLLLVKGPLAMIEIVTSRRALHGRFSSQPSVSERGESL